MVMASELVCRNKNMLFKQYTPDFLLHQRMSASVVSPRASACYTPIQDLESKTLLYNLLTSASTDPDSVVADFAHIFEIFSASIVYTTTSGLRILTGHEWQIETSHECLQNIIKAGQVGAWIVDALPWLNVLPKALAPWKKTADAWHDKWDKLHMTNYHDALQRPGWNWAKCFTQSNEASQMTETELAWSLGMLCDAGVETTNTQLQISILACCASPDWIPMAQKELDRVVGNDRLPTFEDLDKLPYMQAVVEKCFRWRHLAPTGSLVIFLAIAMRNDKSLYEDPEVFCPERWLDETNPDRMPRSQSGNFGYGRRVCPGRFIAQRPLIIAMARMLWAFDISSEDGTRLAVDETSFAPAFISEPLPFKARFKIRDEHRRPVIEREFNETEKDVGKLIDEVRRRQVATGLKHWNFRDTGSMCVSHIHCFPWT
ncbi:cytochrome P450 [Sporormia fimetaria CBS 119925]|uniref:Cytochrome P450 n=1 Tax=Sporormia fimetaria CBS 119925 TaxID=1340428 RepID=A0A6A6VFS1_9PLEO|nr:cytochrome P450 [Sporormia fimetaria CBS 119925]